MDTSAANVFSSVFNTTLLHAAMRSSVPIMYAGLCAAITQQAGILNIGTEGIMLIGAFVAVTVSYFAQSWLVGVLCAMLVGMIVAWILALGNLRYNANMPAICTAMNMFAVAITRFGLESIFHTAGNFSSPEIVPIPTVHFKFMENIKILNDIFNDWCLTEWAVILFVALLYVVIFKTTWGLHMRSVGRMEQAAKTAGINVTRIKYQAITVGGLLGGLAGAHLSLGYSVMFQQNMTNNRGFMGIAAMWFGNANPVGTVAGAFIFGFFDSVGARLQPFYGYASRLILAMPHLATIIILSIVLFVKKQNDAKRKSSLPK